MNLDILIVVIYVKNFLIHIHLIVLNNFLNMYLTIHGDNIHTDSYALLNVAEYYQRKKQNTTRVRQLYVQLYRNGDPQVKDSFQKIIN